MLPRARIANARRCVLLLAPFVIPAADRGDYDTIAEVWDRLHPPQLLASRVQHDLLVRARTERGALNGKVPAAYGRPVEACPPIPLESLAVGEFDVAAL